MTIRHYMRGKKPQRTKYSFMKMHHGHGEENRVKGGRSWGAGGEHRPDRDGDIDLEALYSDVSFMDKQS